MRVSIEQTECIACGLCPEIEPNVFFTGSDNYSYVADETHPANELEPRRQGFSQTVGVLAMHLDGVIEAASECPVDCIYVHEDSDVDIEGDVITANLP